MMIQFCSRTNQLSVNALVGDESGHSEEVMGKRSAGVIGCPGRGITSLVKEILEKNKPNKCIVWGAGISEDYLTVKRSFLRLPLKQTENVFLGTYKVASDMLRASENMLSASDMLRASENMLSASYMLSVLSASEKLDVFSVSDASDMLSAVSDVCSVIAEVLLSLGEETTSLNFMFATTKHLSRMPSLEYKYCDIKGRLMENIPWTVNKLNEELCGIKKLAKHEIAKLVIQMCREQTNWCTDTADILYLVFAHTLLDNPPPLPPPPQLLRSVYTPPSLSSPHTFSLPHFSPTPSSLPPGISFDKPPSLPLHFLYFVAISLVGILFCLCILLLLLAGDIETNPGPTNSSEKPGFGELVTIPGIESRWYALGLALKLDRKSLMDVKTKHSNQTKCKREMFQLAVKNGVTWKEIIKGLCDIDLRASARSVCDTYNIHPNGLSSYLSCSEDSVEPDSPTTEVKSVSASIEFKTFQSTCATVVSEVTRDPIMLANAVFSRGIITQESLHGLRVISSDHNKAVKLVSLIEATLLEYPFKFEAFTNALRSISSYVALADKISQLYMFNRVSHKMKDYLEDRLDMNYLSAELNNSQLISDEVRIRAAGAANFVDMCHTIFVELQAKELDEPYLSLLDSFPNTKEVCTTLRALQMDSNPMQVETERDISNKTSSSKSLPESRKPRDEGFPAAAKSPVTSPFGGEKFPIRAQQSPDLESDSYMSASSDTHRTSMPHRDDSNSQSEFLSLEATPMMGSSELTIRHSANLGEVKRTDNFISESVEVATIRKSGDSGFSKPSDIPVVTPDAALSSAVPIVTPDSPISSALKSTSKSVSSGSGDSKKTGKPKEEKASGAGKKPKQNQVRGPKPKLQHDKFQAALKRWDVFQVNSLLAKGEADVEHMFEDQQTALMLAAIEGNKDMVRTLLQQDASVVARDQEGCTALYLAASNGNYEAVKFLAQQPLADVNVKNKDGDPLLMEPAKKGFSMVTELLVQYGVKVDVESSEGETPLYVAIRKGNYDVVKVLLDSNAEFTKQCKKTHCTPLEEALEGDDTEIVRLLMNATARVNEKSKQLFECKTGDEVKHLISKGAKVNTRDSNEATPLLVHAHRNNIEIVKELIHQRANVDLQDCHGYSALGVAAKMGSLELVQLLVKHGAILDLKESEHGYTSLMFAIVDGHVRIVKDLVLAKANVNIRNRDDKSSLDLARDGGNLDIQHVLNMQTTASSASDPFISILSSYMVEKGEEKKKSATRSPNLPGKESLKSRANKVPKAPDVPEEDSTHVAEVRKYQKRIADLETRIHDLTILGTMDIADESDLTYMERGRLESEFKKLKESKKKAEQYAVEAKQTAQRLSADNFKLREDLSKERHYNELTRKNMMREVELNVERGLGHTKTAVIRSEVFDEEVANRAFLGKGAGSLYQKVAFTGKEIKALIMEQTVRLNLFHVVVAGLPFSGKTTLVETLFDPPKSTSKNPIDLYEGIIHRSKMSDESYWFEGSKLQAEVHTIIAAFANFFAKEHKLPNIDTKNLNLAGTFDDPEVQGYFETTCEALQKLVINVDDGTKVERMLSGSLALINVYDVGVDKAVYEFMMAVKGRNKNLLLVNVLDLLFADKDTMMKPLHLADSKYIGNYGPNQASYFKDGSALYHFMSYVESAYLSESTHTTENTLIVGTHADKFHPQSECNKRKGEVLSLIEQFTDKPDTYVPEMVTVNATSEEDCRRVKTALLKLIDSNKEFEIDIPVKFIFLRYVLYCTKKVYMKREEVVKYAKKCGMKESEVDYFLEIFRNCASIVSSDDQKEFLHAYVILLPVNFLCDINKLYFVPNDETIPSDMRELAKYGIVSERVLRALWQGSDNLSMPIWDFYVSILKNVVLLMELDGGNFFCPSLRLEHSDGPLRTSSLVISSKLASFSSKQCAFVKNLTGTHQDVTLKLYESCPYYNCVEFLSTCKSDEKEGKITIRFFHNFIEVFVDRSNISSSHAANLYSILKTDCVAIMNEISQIRYTFSVACPKSSLNPSVCHFVHFDILDTSTEDLQCAVCKIKINVIEGMHWVKAAYQGSHRAAVQAGDVIDPTTLLTSICKDLSSLKIREIGALSEKLMVGEEFAEITRSGAPMDEVLFNVLYCWHCKNPTATKRTLALVVRECELFKQAVILDPKLLSRIRTPSTDQISSFSSKEITLIASSWTESWDPEELAEVLEITTIPEKGSDADKCFYLLERWLAEDNGDKRENIVRKFNEKEYPSMASFISDDLHNYT